MFYTCAKHAPAAERGGAISNGAKTLVVDIHCHRGSARAAEMMAAEAIRSGIELVVS